MLLLILPPTPPSPYPIVLGSSDLITATPKFLKEHGVVRGFRIKLKGLDTTLLILLSWGMACGGLDPARGSLPIGKPVDRASYIFRETSFNLRTSATVCNIFSPEFYSKLTKDGELPPPPDSVTYLGIIEQTSVRFSSWSSVSMNRKYAKLLSSLTDSVTHLLIVSVTQLPVVGALLPRCRHYSQASKKIKVFLEFMFTFPKQARIP